MPSSKISPSVRLLRYSEVFKGAFLRRLLAIVYNIVESHKGIIEVESAEGKGTTFRVAFPVLERTVSEEEAS